MAQNRRLGMGLSALIGGAGPGEEADPIRKPDSTIDVSLVRPNPYQPRREFNESEIQALATSIGRDGVLQPVVVRATTDGSYELVAGERRWRASKKAGLERIPAIIRKVDDKKMLELALVENLQRSDLNPIEKARAFRQLIQLNGWTQEQVAESVGMGRPTVANFIRLLDLPAEVQEAVSRGTLSMGHARALLAAPGKGAMLKLLHRVLEEDLTVRSLEKLVSVGEPKKTSEPSAKKEPYVFELEQKLMDRLGTKVQIRPNAVVIPYRSNKELTALLRRLGAI